MERLSEGAPYPWGHFGACNCGHLAQSLTARSPAEIHRAAIASVEPTPVDDWATAAVEYCPLSGLPLDAVIDEMLAAGLRLADIRHLEHLSDPVIVRRIGRHLVRNRREDLIAYLAAWADLLDEELAGDEFAGDEFAGEEPLAAE